MFKKVAFVILSVFALAGCATTRTQPAGSPLQTRVGELERQLESKDEEIRNLQYELKDLSYEVDKLKGPSRRSSSVSDSSSSKNDGEIIRVGVSAETVQKALKKAGYYDGNIDGKVGAKTKAAIENFQRDHNLKADGILGGKTWSALKNSGSSKSSSAE